MSRFEYLGPRPHTKKPRRNLQRVQKKPAGAKKGK